MSNPFKVVRRAEVPPTEWDALVESSPDGWLYQTDRWLRLVEPENPNPLTFGLRNADGHLVALLPLYRRDLSVRGVLTIRRLYTGLSGPVISSAVHPNQRIPILKELFHHVDTVARDISADLLEVRTTPLAPSSLPPLRPSLNPLFYAGLTSPVTTSFQGAVQPLTRVIDLSKSEEQILMEMDKRCRSQIRQAEKLGLSFAAIDERDELRAFQELHEGSWERTGLAPHPLSHFTDMWDALRPGGNIQIFLARHEGRNVAGVMLHVFKGGALYWQGCSAGDALALRPNNYLLWNAIVWAKRAGCRFFEVGRIYPHPPKDSKELAVARYKEQFGRDEFDVFEGQKVYSMRKFVALWALRGVKDLLARRSRMG